MSGHTVVQVDNDGNLDLEVLYVSVESHVDLLDGPEQAQRPAENPRSRRTEGVGHRFGPYRAQDEP